MDIPPLAMENWWQIALNLQIKDLFSLCNTNRSLTFICGDPYFWRQRLEQDYPDLIIPSRHDPKILYQGVYRGLLRIVSLYSDDRFLGGVALNPQDTLAELVDDIIGVAKPEGKVGIYFNGIYQDYIVYGLIYPGLIFDGLIRETPHPQNNIFKNADGIVITRDPHIIRVLQKYTCLYCAGRQFGLRYSRQGDELYENYCMNCRRRHEFQFHQ